jgi:hypothetical protein
VWGVSPGVPGPNSKHTVVENRQHPAALNYSTLSSSAVESDGEMGRGHSRGGLSPPLLGHAIHGEGQLHTAPLSDGGREPVSPRIQFPGPD